MALDSNSRKSFISLTSNKSIPSPLLTLLFTALLCLLGFLYLHPTTSSSSSTTTTSFHRLFISSGANSTLSSYLHSLTLQPHLAGTPQSLQPLHFLHSHFSSLHLPTHSLPLPSLLSFPTHSSLSLSLSLSHSLPLNDASSSAAAVVIPYHAYSPSGGAYAEAVFVNEGRAEDYGALEALGVNVSGRVAVARRGEVGRGAVVAEAAGKGAAAVLMYTERTVVGGVERGTVMNMAKGVGDPLTPGWGAEEGGETLPLGEALLRTLPAIPSMPISAQNADLILRSLQGPPPPPHWRSKLQGLGPGPTILNFTYQGENKVAKIHNIFAEIRGREEPDRYVLLGNHRDAWTYGAVDPNSGTAALLDIARRYALLLSKGWAPRRTIILCSWDAEEFGMIGSTEWVEKNLANLGSKAVAYLNVDCAVQGPGLFASATPQLDDLIVEVTKEIKDPDSEGVNVYQSWTATNKGVNIQRLGRLDSDFAPFLQHAGVPSLDLYYGEDYPVYHTAFDSYDWMIKYGDPQFHRHVAVAGIWGLLGLRLADDPILPFNYSSYAAQLQMHTDVLGKMLDSGVSIQPLVKSIQELASAAKLVEAEIKKLKEVTDDNLLELKRRSLNDRLMLAERGFTDADGLQGRKWFKHLIYGPPEDPKSKLSFFPGIADAISRASGMAKTEGQAAVQHEVWRVARAIQRAANVLRGELF